MRLLPILVFLLVPILAEAADPPDDPLASAIRHFHAQELDAAEASLLELRETQPGNAEAVFYLGRVYLAQRRSQAAVQALEQSARLDSESSTYQFWLAEALVARIDEVAVLFKLSIANRIRAAYEKAVELEPESLEARVAVARYHAEAPGVAGGNPAKAEQQLEEIRLRDPAMAHVTQALIHERLGRLEPAEEELATAVVVDPDSVVSWRESGLFYLRRQRPEEAQGSFDAVLARQPDDPVALFELARTAITLSERQLVRAGDALQAYLRLEPGPGPKVFGKNEAPRRTVAHQHLGLVYERQGRPDLAARELEAAAGLGESEAEERIDFPLDDAAMVD